jgi:hypothetical protein
VAPAEQHLELREVARAHGKHQVAIGNRRRIDHPSKKTAEDGEMLQD